MRPQHSGAAGHAPYPPAQVVSACRRAADVLAAVPADDPAGAVEAALDALRDGLDGAFVSAFLVEHERLWILAQRGYSLIPDGISVQEGVMGRAVRSARTQFAVDVSVDPDFVSAVPGIVSELASPLRIDGVVVGVVNVETVRPLPAGSPRLVRPLLHALAPVVGQLRARRSLDLSGAARLFVYMGSLRSPRAIADLAAGSLARILPVETVQLLVGADEALEQLALWQSRSGGPAPFETDAVEGLVREIERSAVFQLLDGRDVPLLASVGARSAVVIPLRANGSEFGTLIGTSRAHETFDRDRAELAALLGAHAAASLDAALLIGRERQTALTDPLTGLLNRRGFEERLAHQLAQAHSARQPLSLMVIDCDDFKEVNDRAGHEFGDALLRELGEIIRQVVSDDASAGRLGGDEFVILFPGADSEPAERLARDLRAKLVAGLDEGGFPLRLSAGVATYPYDGAGGTQLIRAADQALYDAKASGKGRVVVFRELVRNEAGTQPAPSAAERRRGSSRPLASVLVEVGEAVDAIWEEQTVQGVLERLCKGLTFVIGATGCAVSRVRGDEVVDAARHALRDIDLGEEAVYLISEFPLTREVLDTGNPRAISFLDEDLDRAEAFVLREMEMNCCLLLRLTVDGEAWGLVELYDMRLRRYSAEDEAVAQFLVVQAGRRLETLPETETRAQRPPVFRLPSAG
jgi:diguanylate cyclase (GGDEF)-like protein